MTKFNTTICLNMIVKDESHIIVNTLQKLISKINFNYYVICDTGSTDNTPILIENFFKSKNIQGEIKFHEWKDFGYNRSLALKCANDAPSDYIFIFDADDEIIGDISFPELTLDSYMLKFGNYGSSYERLCLVKNDGTWYYRGVLHEYICSKKPNPTKGSIFGDYFIISGRTSSRNSDPDKYLKDAKVLEKGYQESLDSGDDLYHRYAYYCANSYKDAGDKERAKEWYLKTLKCQGWFDERYNSCLNLFEIIQDPSRYYYLVESFYHNPRRVEGIYLLIQHYTCEGKYDIAWKYYTWIKSYYENENDELSTKLFARVMDYTFYLPYYMIIVCEKIKNYTTGLKMYEIIFEKMCNPGQWWINNLIFNFQFFIEQNSSFLFEKMKNYLLFLESQCIKLDKNIISGFKKHGFNYFEKLNDGILFYVGFSKENWNLSYSETHALGGSENAVINLAKELSQWYSIVISGDVLEETVNMNGNNITFINRFNLKNVNYKIIIVSRYVSFFTIFPNYKCEKMILMAHDIHFLNNLTGCKKSSEEIIKKNKIDLCICLTNWQKGVYSKLYPQLKYQIINNGITVEKKECIKIPNTFIYTSGSIRGLERLLELWPEILSVLPDAKLNISSYEEFPKDAFDEKLKETIDSFSSIKHHGKLNKNQLYKLMELSEYWLYPCCFDETSCITALEMMAHNVICLYYPRAGLTDTMNGNGIQISHGNEIEKLNLKEKTKIIEKGKKYIETCSWKHRAKKWKKIIENKSIVFYATPDFPQEFLSEYIASLNTKYNVLFTTDISGLEFDELVFVHEVFDQSVFEKYENVSYLNTEPLNIIPRLSYVIYDVYQKFPKIKHFYDYSLSNIKIMNKNGILNTFHLEYLYNPKEVELLKKIKNETEVIYDYGILCSGSVPTTKIDNLTPPRRQLLVRHLLSQGFTVNIISGFDEKRDREIAKCKKLLNIHGQFMDQSSTIFEHIRCNRLLYAGYNILSETSQYLEPSFKFPNLEFKDYFSFFTKCYCFIHSCNIKGPKRLNHLLDNLPFELFEKVFINNIGPNLDNFENAKIEVTNYSENNLLFEIPTINKIKKFSENNPGSFILYIHTKGVSFNDDYQEENDWINMMLYFLLKKNEQNCFICPKLLYVYNSLGCNYTTDGKDYHPDGTTTTAPPHYSGNFWWATTDFLKKLNYISEENINKNDAEYWLHTLNHSYFELHHSGIDHYRERYPKERFHT